MGHRDPRGDLQHAHVAGGAGCREGEAGPRTCKPDGSPDYGVLSHALSRLNILSFNTFLLSTFCIISLNINIYF